MERNTGESQEFFDDSINDKYDDAQKTIKQYFDFTGKSRKSYYEIQTLTLLTYIHRELEKINKK